jgi:hypothetical protein
LRRNKRDEEEDNGRAVKEWEDKDEAEAEEEDANGAASIVKAWKFSSLSYVGSLLFATESE